MKSHLTEREFIEYQFKLASDSQMAEIAGHLESCPQCREHLEQLKHKFAALDLLREDIKVSEDLISQVIEQVSSAPRKMQPRIISFWKSTWAGAAAAVLVIGLMLLSAHLIERREIFEPGEKPSEIIETRKAPHKMLLTRAEEMKTEAEFEQPSGHGVPAEPGPPFAPASAIELVTLPRRDKVQLTIYNSADLTLVRERRNLTLKKGWNWLQFMWANTLIDPTSLNLEPLERKDKIDIQQLVFPARLRELGRWLIRSKVSGQVPFEITYLTSGLSWRAFYMGTLSQDEKTMFLQGYVRVGNDSGEDYENAQTRLIVGQVHILDQIAELARRQYPYGRPGKARPMVWGREEERDRKLDYSMVMNGIAGALGELALKPKEIKKEGLSEYFLYTIEGTETIPDEWGKRLLSFEAKDVNVTSLYKYDEQRWVQQTIRFVSFANDQEHNLGQTPIPDGDVKIYSQTDSQGYLSYVGGTGIKYIPVNEEIELNLGPARLVKVEPTLMDFKTENYVFDSKGNISGWDEIRTWKVEITNTRTLPIEIEITRGFGMAYWTLQADIPFERYDATHARFKLNLQPRSKQTFGYTVRTYHGARQEISTKIKSKNNVRF